MIRPENNLHRHAISLDGIWTCRPDPHIGQKDGWQNGFENGLAIAVPGSWNEQLSEAGMMNHVGIVWYQRDILVPAFAQGFDLTLHFGCADYAAEVFVDGKCVGTSGAPKLPFEIDITDHAMPMQMIKLVVKVDARLPEHGPMQRITREDYMAENRPKGEYWPAVRFDFFPFGGLNRSVTLCLLPKTRMTGLRIDTGWTGQAGTLRILAEATMPCLIEISLDGRVLKISSGANPDGISVAGELAAFTLLDVMPWSPDDPKLYMLKVVLKDDEGKEIDSVSRRIGFRTVRVEGEKFILNGAPIQLKGFGKHEDTPIAGRGVNLPMLVKDFQLLKWTGANSVRTSHYPYDESFLDMADEQGILVISEIFSVNLDFRRTDERDQSATALIARDRAHACVIAWSLSNEPGFLGEPEYQTRSGDYWTALFAHARSLDDTRPMTVANVQYAGVADPAFDESDFITINRYFGWYTEPGQLDRARTRLTDIFDTLQASYGKPIFVSEFGADAIAGMHATTDQMWTEDYQSDLIELYWEIIEQHPACIGGHVWNFADFRTAQHARRAVMNRKGVFTRERDPKRAAFTVRKLWLCVNYGTGLNPALVADSYGTEKRQFDLGSKTGLGRWRCGLEYLFQGHDHIAFALLYRDIGA